MLVDSHCHLDFEDFDADRDAVLERARARGVGRMVTISTRARQFGRLRAIVDREPDVFCSIGTHPHNADEELGITADELIRVAQYPKVVAIGEAGLDYHYQHSTPANQAAGLRVHIAAARETGLPLVIHARDADEDMERILKEEAGKGAYPAVLHCFSSGRALAMAGISLGFYVSFSGILTFKNSDDDSLHSRRSADGSDPGRNGRAVSGAAAQSREAKRAGFCRGYCRGARNGSRCQRS